MKPSSIPDAPPSYGQFLDDLSGRDTLDQSLDFVFDRMEQLIRANDPAKRSEALLWLTTHRARVKQAIVDNTRQDLRANRAYFETDGSAADKVAMEGWPDTGTGNADRDAAGIPNSQNPTDADRAAQVRAGKTTPKPGGPDA